MRIWIDTEFNGFQGELISMALVSEDNDIFYESIGCGEPCAWVHENVMPIINKDPIPKTEFWTKLEQYLNQWDSIHIIADWPEDIAHFCQALIFGPGYAIPTPSKMTFEVNRGIDAESELPHNALADAIAIRDMHLQLEAELFDQWDGCS